MTSAAEIDLAPESETDVLLKDGSTVRIRPVRSSDENMMLDLFSRVSQRSMYLRFHHVTPGMSREEVRRYTNVDGDRTFGLAATEGGGDSERIIAVGHYARIPDSDRAEVAFLVEDSHQGRGIATHLLEQLAVIGRAKGIHVFEADVLAENRAMMDVFRDTGFKIGAKFEYGTYHLAFPIQPTKRVEERTAEREKTATVASIRFFFQPQRVAVVGASRERGTIGAELFHNLLNSGFSGIVYPVNYSAEGVGGVKAYPSVLDIPDEIDLAVIAVPAEHVLEVVEQCGEKGVRGLVIITAGFREVGAEGAQRERELLARVRSYGMRLIGPNCMGVLNTDPSASLNATFSPVFPPPGNVALSSQSGALGIALLDYARSLNIGLSTFASVGNKADVSGNDLIQYWEEDPKTDVILLYLESFGNPRKFVRLARRISPVKPIVVVKSGRTAAGSRAAASHTGALATADVASDALFRQAGVIRTDTLEQLFDVASLLANQPLPQGRGVAILSNGGGPAILAADACESYGLRVPEPSDETAQGLRAFAPSGAGLKNPFDLLAAATAEDYAKALRLLLNDDCYDSIIVIFTPPLVTEPEAVARAIRDVTQEHNGRKTVLACFMSARGAPKELSLNGKFIPSFAFPESAALALAKVSEHGEWRKRPAGYIPELAGIRRDKARRVIDEALERTQGVPRWLSAIECNDLLQAYGIRTAPLKAAISRSRALKAAKEIGFPVALKLNSSTIIHKTDIGGVVLDIGHQSALVKALNAIRSRVAAAGKLPEMEGVLVQKMVPNGIEAIVGVTQDPSFGPLMMFGLGGTYVELLKDVVFRVHPLTDVDAREAIRSARAYPLLEGWRGAPRCDIEALEELLLRVSAMVEDLPEIAEMDLNPVKVLPEGEGCVAVDSRVLLNKDGWGRSALAGLAFNGG